ncbi:MAG: acyl-CoA dehydrogenase family protein [Pseudomonadota bacterium]|nr:acyl-CoA dehydrogenase family protein [Pseudomonadota bacterium]
MIQFSEENELFRKSVRDFINREVRPNVEHWEDQGFTPRNVWSRCGELGFLGLPFSSKYGGAEAEYTFSMIFTEEMAQCGSLGVALGLAVQTDMATPALNEHGSEALKEKFLRPAIAGKMIGAIAVTEPNCGSDVAGLNTRAEKKGDHYILNGTKMFITNGTQADFYTTLVRTKEEAGHKCFSLFIVPANLSGVKRSRVLKKICHLSSDTAEIIFDNVKIPKENLVGEENSGFIYQMQQFQYERLAASVQMLGVMKRCYQLTKEYVKSRTVFGKNLNELQVTKHKLAQIAAEIKMIESFTHSCVEFANAKKDFSKEVSMLKLLAAQAQQRVTEECTQLHGGYGLMSEYEVARYFRDSKLAGIGGGSNEIMKEIIIKMEGL